MVDGGCGAPPVYPYRPHHGAFFLEGAMKTFIRILRIAASLFIASGLGVYAHAAAVADYIKPAEVIKVNAVQSVTSESIKISTTVRGFAANDPYAIKSVSVPKSNFMSFVKGNLKNLVKINPWWVAYAAVIASAGWVIDELTGQVSYNQVVFTGQCGTNFGNYYQIGFEQCLAYVLQGNTLKDMILISGPSQLTVGQTSTYQVYSCASSNPSVCYGARLLEYTPQSSSSGGPVVVTDDALYDSIASQMMNNETKAADAFMVPDAYPYPYPFVPAQTDYIPGVSESDAELLDWYLRGLAQSTDPTKPYYVPPEKLAEIQALAAQLAQGQTPEGQVDAANDALSKPLTQKQLEESLKKEREKHDKETADALGEQPNLQSLTDAYDAFRENVANTGSQQITALPDTNFTLAGMGQCYIWDYNMTISSFTVTLSTAELCDKYYYPYFLPALSWFFYFATGLYMWFSLRDAYSRRV